MLLFGIFKHLHGGKRENICKINAIYVYTNILPHFDNYVNLAPYIQDLQKRKNRVKSTVFSSYFLYLVAHIPMH